MSLTLRLGEQDAGGTYAPIRSVGDPPNGVLGVVLSGGPELGPYFVVDSSVEILATPFVPTPAGEALPSSTPVDLDDVLDGLDGDAAQHLWTTLTMTLGKRVLLCAARGDLQPIGRWGDLLERVGAGLAERGIFKRTEENDDGG